MALPNRRRRIRPTRTRAAIEWHPSDCTFETQRHIGRQQRTVDSTSIGQLLMLCSHRPANKTLVTASQHQQTDIVAADNLHHINSGKSKTSSYYHDHYYYSWFFVFVDVNFSQNERYCF